MDIEYWEIWNEPDCFNPDGTNPCWQGTEEEFVEFFVVALRHLKATFPHLKIGGPAICYFLGCPDFMDKFFKALKREDLRLDFFSFHCYARTLDWIEETIDCAKALVDKYGQSQAELHLNEWNYVKGWLGDDWLYTIGVEKGLKGASFITGAMCVGQKSPLDMLMYYDARPCQMNGMFNTDTFYTLKGYYPIAYFSKLQELGGCVESESTSYDLQACTATNGKNSAILLTHYNDDDATPAKLVQIEIEGVHKGAKIEVYVLDSEHDMTLFNDYVADDSKVSLTLDIPLYTTYYISVNNE